MVTPRVFNGSGSALWDGWRCSKTIAPKCKKMLNLRLQKIPTILEILTNLGTRITIASIDIACANLNYP